MTAATLFVHIPKTAGTSLRQSALRHFGSADCLFDYGPAARETSEDVREWMYRRRDPYGLQKALRTRGARFFGGHFPAVRYLPLFGCLNTISFVRSPRAQVPSHFAHQARHHGYQGSFTQFLRSPQGGGIQSSMLQGVPLEALRFVGVTERYAESLEALAAELGCPLAVLHENGNPSAAAPADYDGLLSAADEAFATACAGDLALHRRANELLDRRLQALRDDRPYVHGALTHVDAQRIDGFAFTPHDERPVMVDLFVDGRPLAQVPASRDRSALRSLGAPRNGYVGFSFREGAALPAGTRVEARAGAQVVGEAIVA